MMKLASLTKLAGAVLEIVLADGFIRSYRIERLRGIEWLDSTAALYVGRVVILAGSSVFASARPKKVTAVFNLRALV